MGLQALSLEHLQDPAEYIEAAEVFIEFVLKNFGMRETDIFLQASSPP